MVAGLLTPHSKAHRHGFSQREVDAESALLHYRARSYDPRTGRFVQKDPLHSNVIREHYAYGYNNPVSVTDPTGLQGSPNSQFLSAEQLSESLAASEKRLGERRTELERAKTAESVIQQDSQVLQLRSLATIRKFFQPHRNRRYFKALGWDAMELRLAQAALAVEYRLNPGEASPGAYYIRENRVVYRTYADSAEPMIVIHEAIHARRGAFKSAAHRAELFAESTDAEERRAWFATRAVISLAKSGFLAHLEDQVEGTGDYSGARKGTAALRAKHYAKFFLPELDQPVIDERDRLTESTRPGERADVQERLGLRVLSFEELRKYYSTDSGIPNGMRQRYAEAFTTAAEELRKGR